MLSLGGRAYLDTNTVIAIIEARAPFVPGQKQFLAGIESGEIDCVSSELTLAECLVKPLRAHDRLMADDYSDFLNGRDQLPILPFTRTTFVRSAEIRALTGAKLPDAMHIACAELAGCAVFMSADTGLRLPAGMRRVSWDDIGKEPS